MPEPITSNAPLPLKSVNGLYEKIAIWAVSEPQAKDDSTGSIIPFIPDCAI